MTAYKKCPFMKGGGKRKHGSVGVDGGHALKELMRYFSDYLTRKWIELSVILASVGGFVLASVLYLIWWVVS